MVILKSRLRFKVVFTLSADKAPLCACTYNRGLPRQILTEVVSKWKSSSDWKPEWVWEIWNGRINKTSQSKILQDSLASCFLTGHFQFSFGLHCSLISKVGKVSGLYPRSNFKFTPPWFSPSQKMAVTSTHWFKATIYQSSFILPFPSNLSLAFGTCGFPLQCISGNWPLLTSPPIAVYSQTLPFGLSYTSNSHVEPLTPRTLECGHTTF